MRYWAEIFLLWSDIDPVDFDLSRGHALDARLEEAMNCILPPDYEVFGCFHEAYEGAKQWQYDPAEYQQAEER